MLRQKGSTEPVEGRDKVKAKDIVNGKITLEKVGEEKYPEEPLNIKLGEPNIPSDLEKSMIGMKIGESKSIKTTLADDYPSEDLQGKEVIFHVTVESLLAEELPELNDEFAAGVGIEEVKSVADLKKHIEDNLKKEAEGKAKEEVNKKIVEELVEKNSFLIPQVLIDEEIRGMVMEVMKLDPNTTKHEDVVIDKYLDQF